jgi:hypothetical protein
MRLLALLALLLLSGCYLRTLFEPAICESYRVTPVNDSTVYIACEAWRALSDSTKRWDNDGRRLP